MNDICMIIQGPSMYVKTLKERYQNTDVQIIYSTWEGEESKYDNDDIVVFSKKPNISGVQNVILQRISSYNGLLKAKELGYKKAIKIRDDCYFTDLSRFLNKGIDFNKLNFLYFLKYHRVGGPDKNSNNYEYFYDLFQISSVDNLLKMWDFEYKQCSYSEQLTTEHVIKTFKKDQLNFIGDYLTNDCDIYWISRNSYLSSVNKEHYKTYIDYK